MFGFLFSWFIGTWGPKISCTKTQTLPNSRIPDTSGNKESAVSSWWSPEGDTYDVDCRWLSSFVYTEYQHQYSCYHTWFVLVFFTHFVIKRGEIWDGSKKLNFPDILYYMISSYFCGWCQKVYMYSHFQKKIYKVYVSPHIFRQTAKMGGKRNMQELWIETL